MAKQMMERKASDNKYLHKEFHILADQGIAYVGEKFGDNGVREYLRQFARNYYALLIDSVKRIGMEEIQKYLEQVYSVEEASQVLKTMLDGNSLIVEILHCPAIEYMKNAGHSPSRWYVETTRTIYETIADEAGLGFELLDYDAATGKASYRFFRRSF